jgi:Domain of unknown function (DUF1844)
MAEYQNMTVSSGEMAQRFIEFVMMQAQNAAFMLGQIPHPQTGKAEVNLDVAQMLIDQLVMIQEKTKGNLNSDEAKILAGAISNLQIAFVEAVRQAPADTPSVKTETPPQVEQKPPSDPTPEQIDPDGKRKFVKSYGA